MENHFLGSRYVTRGVGEAVDSVIQFFLWELIDTNIRAGREMDYLQIFELEATMPPNSKIQRITHRQEQPEFCDRHELHGIEKPINRKVWVIDSGEYATMLLPEEY